MKKRILSFVLALVLAVSLLPVSAFAVGDASPLTFTDESGQTHVATLNETIKTVRFCRTVFLCTRRTVFGRYTKSYALISPFLHIFV